jgi:tetratricopeptide (TPR) repeat protein
VPRAPKSALIVVSLLVAVGAAVGVATRRADRGRTLVERSASAYGATEWSKAADLARERLKEAPDDVSALRLLARSTARLGRDSVANGLFARLGSESLDAEDLYLLGLQLERAARKPEADRLWEKALALEPNHAEVMEHLVIRYSSQNRIIEAAHLAERLARIPGFETKGQLAWASLRFQLGDFTGAAAILKPVLEGPVAAGWDQSQTMRYRKMLARCLLATARPGEAREVQTPIDSAGQDAETSWLLSRAFLQEGALDQAAFALKNAGTYRVEHALEWEPASFLGQARCAKCHQEIFHSHQKSRHATTLSRGQDLAEFPFPASPIRDPDNAGIVDAFVREEGKTYFQTREGNKVRRALVAYAFGSADHYVSFVGPEENGPPYIMSLSYYRSGEESGWTRTSGHSSAGEGMHDFLGKPLAVADGVYKCLFCHSTDPRSALENSGPAATDRAIGCERCHGPGGNHQKAVELGFLDLAIVSPRTASPAARLELCGRCHSYHQSSRMPREDSFWIRFQGTSLPWSRCFTESGGNLDCITCHDPHGNASVSAEYYDSRCKSCHSPKLSENAKSPPSLQDAATHQFRQAYTKSVGSARASVCPINQTRGCVSCHMPPFRSEPLHAAFADHYIRVHPKSVPQPVQK